MWLGIDLGTSSVKALLLDETGAMLGEGAAGYAVSAPRPGWAESDPEEWWRATLAAARAAIGPHSAIVRAIGLSGQMHGVVCCLAGGEPLRPAILWADARADAELAAYRRLEPAQLRRLANPIVTGMAGPTLLWLRAHEPDVYAAARYALQPKDWLRLRLTGTAAAEPSDASATLLYDLAGDRWDAEIIAALGLRAELCAPLLPSAGVAGELSGAAAAELGLRPGLPVATGAADTAAALVGAGLCAPGPVQLSVGTGGQIVALRDAPTGDPARGTHLYRAAAAGQWYVMAAIQNAGLALEWARALLGVDWATAYAEAFSVPAGAEGLSFLPYLSGERTPHLDPHARGAWVGLGLHHSRGHLLRAALEGVAFALRDALDALDVPAAQIRLAGGGTRDERWRQLLADVLDRPLLASEVRDASARGAALIAATAAGAFPDILATARLAPEPQLCAAPGPERAAYAEPLARYRALYPRLRGWGVV